MPPSLMRPLPPRKVIPASRKVPEPSVSMVRAARRSESHRRSPWHHRHRSLQGYRLRSKSRLGAGADHEKPDPQLQVPPGMRTVSPADAWFSADCTAVTLQDAAVIVAACAIDPCATAVTAIKRISRVNCPGIFSGEDVRIDFGRYSVDWIRIADLLIISPQKADQPLRLKDDGRGGDYLADFLGRTGGTTSRHHHGPAVIPGTQRSFGHHRIPLS